MSFHKSRISRRQFLRGLGAAALGALIPDALLSPAQVNSLHAARPARPLLGDLRKLQNPDPRKFVILGAGLAGLCAAYELEKLGHTCVILEAETEHVGGRARTLRFENGLYGEAGAMRIPRNHELTRHYITEFGLSLRPFVMGNPQGYVYLRGQRARISSRAALRVNYNFPDSEQTLPSGAVWGSTISERVGSMTADERANLHEAVLTEPRLLEWDRLSLAKVFERAGFSQEAVEWMAVGSGIEAELMGAATEFIRDELDETWFHSFDEIVGGTDTLPAAFAEGLISKPRMGCPVIRIEQVEGEKPAAVYLQNGQEVREEGDFLLCTIPFSALINVDTPHFSGEKRRAIRTLNYDSSTKVLAVARRRFWETDDGIYGGASFTDLPSVQTYYPSDNAGDRDDAVSAGEGVMLASYSWGANARRLGGLPPRQRHAIVLDAVSHFHPQMREEDLIRRAASWSWDNHRWNLGAFTLFAPGQHTHLYPSVIQPEGRVYFAGEHASLTHAWMQGALESALEAVRMMLTATD